MIDTIRLCGFADEAGSTLGEQIDALKSNGVGLIELRNVDGVNIGDMDDDAVRSTADALHAAGVEVWSIGSPVGKVPIDCDFLEHRDKAARIFRFAGMLGSPRVRVFSFFTSDPDADRAAVIRRLRELVSLAADCGVDLYHENEKEIYGDVPRRVRVLLEEVTGLKSVYDPANFIQCGVDPEESLPLAEAAGYLHVKDCRFSGELVPAGCGDARIADVIARAEGDKVLTLEPHLRVFEGYAGIDKSEMKNAFAFDTGADAFRCAAGALKDVMRTMGFREEGGVWKR